MLKKHDASQDNLIVDVHIYNYALAKNEVKALYKKDGKKDK
jgi:hypothetical protein